MENYEVRFKKKDLYTLVGGLWALISIIDLVLLIIFIFVLQPSFQIGSIFIVIELLVIIFLGLILSKYYIRLPLRTYLKMSQKLEVHKGLFRGNRIIIYESIEEVRILGNKMFLMLIRNPIKEFEINSDLIYQKDLDLLLKRFSSLNIKVSRI